MLRLLGWNALLLVVGVVLAAMAGEAWFRLSAPFTTRSEPLEFVPNAGILRPPNTEIRSTNRLDFWNVSRTNSLGFLDREPPTPERAAATCHISMIGDSFVEAKHVPIHDKFHVRLEALAADELPHLEITTSAFGIENTGQVQQLPFYDEYARLLHPKLLVLVFVLNDFTDNPPVLRTLTLRGVEREWKLRSEPAVRRRPDGKLELSLPQDRLPSSSRIRTSWAAARAMEKKAADRSRLAFWLRAKKRALFPPPVRPIKLIPEVEALRRQPGYASLFDDMRVRRHKVIETFARRDLPPLFEDALQYTAFALEQFQQRADRDGAKLVILATHTLKVHGTLMFERLSQMAAVLGIPVIDQSDYILRQGAKPRDARWPHDYHWNPAGHRWAAEALLEYLEEHPATCDRPTGAAALLEPTP